MSDENIPIIETEETFEEAKPPLVESFLTVLGEVMPERVYLLSAPENALRRDESLKLALVLAKRTKTLYINTMLSRNALTKALANEPEAMNDGNLHCMLITDGKMVDRFDAIIALVREEGFKALVISSFELAAHSVRHRELLATQINQLRTDHRMAILIFTKEKMARIGKKQEFLTGAIGLLLSFSEPAIGLGPDDDLALEEPEYMKLCRAREEELKANPPPIPPANLISYEDFAGTPIEQVLPESDWDNPLYTNIPKMVEVIAELRLKKEKNLLRMDPLKYYEYIENREEFSAKMEELLGEPSKC